MMQLYCETKLIFSRSCLIVGKIFPVLKPPRWQSPLGQHGANMTPVGPRWTSCWPEELCYRGSKLLHTVYSVIIRRDIVLFYIHPAGVNVKFQTSPLWMETKCIDYNDTCSVMSNNCAIIHHRSTPRRDKPSRVSSAWPLSLENNLYYILPWILSWFPYTPMPMYC